MAQAFAQKYQSLQKKKKKSHNALKDRAAALFLNVIT